MTKSSRINITVPGDMKRRMDEIERRVNWSAVAAAAFDAELKRTERPKPPRNQEWVTHANVMA